jgi:UDP-2,3-diacylglucosamine pyrophosphatase LpxH
MDNVHELTTARRVRSVFISDVHLGFPGCSADHLADFLRSIHCENLYLVGDIIDFWYLKKKRYWSQSHNNVVRCILGKAKHDTNVVFIPGNHDEVLRQYDGVTLGNVKIMRQAVHEAADGRRYLLIHGDEYDCIVKNSRFIAMLGSAMYDWLLYANRLVNSVRSRFGHDYWSLAKFLKHKVKNAVSYISSFEQAVVSEARQKAVDGLICGHIHHAEIARIKDTMYLNCGDWVESNTALVELHDGTIELLHWSDEKRVLKQLDPMATEAVTKTASEAATAADDLAA